jgi:hypothetical protein
MTKAHSTMQLAKDRDNNMRLDKTIKSIAIATSVWMWEFIKHHKAKSSTREQKAQQRGE